MKLMDRKRSVVYGCDSDNTIKLIGVFPLILIVFASTTPCFSIFRTRWEEERGKTTVPPYRERGVSLSKIKCHNSPDLEFQYL